MKNRSEESRLRWKMFLVSLICLAGAGAGGFRLYQELYESGIVGKGKTLGKVERRESKVRRKTSSSFVWSNIQANEILFRKDSVQTGRGSAASIRLNDGSLLDIGENSLVVMDDANQLNLNFLRGTAVVHKADGGDSKISVGKDGQAKVEELQIRLVKPDPLARYYVSGREAKAVQFAWNTKSKSGTELFTFRLSTDKFFKSPQTQVFTTSDPKVRELKATLGPGKYYWQVFAKDPGTAETRQFRILSTAPLQPIWPTDASKLTNVNSDPLVQFRWVDPKSAGLEDVDVTLGDHRIELSRDPTFRALVASESINPTNGTASIRRIPDGMIYWRLKSSYGDLSIFGSTRSFEYKNLYKPPIEPSPAPVSRFFAPPSPSPTPTPSPTPSPTPIPKIPAPAQAKPEAGAVIKLLEEKDLQATWSKVSGAGAYEVFIYQQSKDTSPPKLVLHQVTDENHLSLKALNPGDYLWTLLTLDSQKRRGDPLPYRRFTLTYGEPLAPPEVTSPEVQ